MKKFIIILIMVGLVITKSEKKNNEVYIGIAEELIEEQEIEEVLSEEPIDILEEEVEEVIEEVTPVYYQINTISNEVKTFLGKVTHYGPDCVGCSGITYSDYDVRDTIYYYDSEYGYVRIVAAPKEVPLYTILALHNYKGDPITVIVLDRGNAITGTKFDILVSSESEANYWGIQDNVEFEILRWGR